MIWDTHAHLDDHRFEGELDNIINRAKDEGITRISNIGYDEVSSRRSVELAQKYELIYAAVGVHPHDASKASTATWDHLLELSRKPKVIAWGEIGLDYYRDLSPRQIQKEVFIEQIGLANYAKLPIIIHNRDAHGDILEIIKEHRPKYGGVFHCYSGSWEMAKVLLKIGFYISFAGPLTYKNNKQTVEVAQNIPLDRFLVETDAPYLTPEPFRGKRNEPAYVRKVVEKIAALRGLTFEEVADQARVNGEALFKVSSK